MSLPTPYTTNLCINPSFQQGSLGTYPVVGTETLTLDTTEILYGFQSLLVSTPGSVAGEGCYLPGAVIPTATPCSLSVYLYGSGNVNVNALTDVDGSTFLVEGGFPDTDVALAATMPAKLTTGWNRIVINGLYANPGTVLYLSVTTTTKQQATFWVSGIQIEPESPAHPYIDGDQDQCVWLDSPYGRSQKLYQFVSDSVGRSITAGEIVAPLNTGLKSTATVKAGKTKAFSSRVASSLVKAVGSMTDFAVWTTADPDPAQTFASWNTQGTNTATGGAWNRVYGVFTPPFDYPNSAGTNLWNRAAYMATGFQFASVPNNATESITDVQTEILPVSNLFSAASPTSYILPREITTTIKPNRLNYCPNPSIEVSAAGWSSMGTGAVSQDGTQSAGIVTKFDEGSQTSGTSSLKVACLANNDGAKISVPFLIPGLTYTASMYLLPGPGLYNISASCTAANNNNGAAIQATGTGTYGVGGYGTGQSYGGIITANNDVLISEMFMNNDPQLLNNTSFAGGSALWWTFFLGTISVTGSPPAGGPTQYALQYTSPGGGGAGYASTGVANGFFPASSGNQFLYTGWFYTTGTQIVLYQNYVDANNNFIAGNQTTYTVPANTWVQLALLGTVQNNPAIKAACIAFGPVANSTTVYGTQQYCFRYTPPWTRISFQFTPILDTVTLQVQATLNPNTPSTPDNFWIDAILIEEGTTLGPYFDGGFGTNYFWESGGSAGLTRSYYLNQFSTRFQAFQNALAQHVPYGISFATPQYALPPGV